MRLRWIPLLILAALLLGPASSWAAIAHVQNKVSATANANSTQAITWASNTTSGNTIVCTVVWADPVNRVLTGITDSQSNTYTLSAFTRQVGGVVDVAIAYATNITGGTTPTVTASFSGSSSFGRHLQCGEFSGLATASVLDQAAGQAQDNPGTGANAVSSGNITTTQADELIVAITCCFATTPPGTAGTSFTMFSAITTEDANTEYRIVSSTGTYAGTFTADGATDDFATRVASFKMAVTASGCRGALSLLNVGGC